MLVSVACPVEPPYLPWRRYRLQCVEHGENWGRANTCAKQNNRPITGFKSKTAPWCADLQYVANLHMTMDIGTGHAVQFLLDTHTIVICAGRSGERVTAQQRWRIRIGPQAQNKELAGLGSN